MSVTTRTRWGPTIGLFMFAPICAEYLLGYDAATGHWLLLAGGLVVLAPLYGGAALLIREVVRRAGLGWPTILLLCAAWGTIQAGLVDQSMFNPDYRGIPYWDLLWAPTRILGVQVSAFAAWTFVLGHVVFSLGAPIAVIECLAGRQHRAQSWLSRPGVVAVAAVTIIGAIIVWWDQMTVDPFRISLTQAIVALVVAGSFVKTAFRVRLPAVRRPGVVLPPMAVGAGALAVATVVQAFATTTWSGLGLVVVITVTAFGVLIHQSRSESWTSHHRLAAAAGALLGSATAGWFIDPIGSVSTAEQLVHHIVMTLLITTITALAVRADYSAPDTATPST